MYQLAFARLCAAALAAVIAVPSVVFAQQAQGVVSVLYAGSLVTPMEGPIKTALQQQGITVQGQPGGSKQLANLIEAGLRSPDVFISVDPELVKKLGGNVASSVTFAGTSLGIAWTPSSKYAAVFDRVAAGEATLKSALETPGLKLGRTDPQLDPKGSYTIQGMTLWLGRDGERKVLGDDENPAQIFPEETLLVRLETAEIDAGFFYRTEAIARGYRFIPLPDQASLVDRITYTLAVMANAPHPDQARAFAEFVLEGPGRAILEQAGLTYFKQGGRPGFGG